MARARRIGNESPYFGMFGLAVEQKLAARGRGVGYGKLGVLHSGAGGILNSGAAFAKPVLHFSGNAVRPYEHEAGFASNRASAMAR